MQMGSTGEAGSTGDCSDSAGGEVGVKRTDSTPAESESNCSKDATPTGTDHNKAKFETVFGDADEGGVVGGRKTAESKL